MVANEKLVLTIPEAGERLGISRAQAYLMAKRGVLPILHLGRRQVVPIAALNRMLENAGAVASK